MKTKIVIEYDTDTEEQSDSVLTQLGLLLIDNNDKVKDFSIQHEQIEEN